MRPGRVGLAAGVVLSTLGAPVWAGPSGGQVVGGAGAIEQAGASTTIRQSSDRLAIEWDSFDIGAHEAVRFEQPSAGSIALNRVLGQDPTQILGTLEANGQVFVLNPHGVLFGSGARVDVGGLVASTLDLSDTDFLVGRYTFEAPDAEGSGAEVVNAGQLRAHDGGYVALLGEQVRNAGTIEAPGGTVALGAGERIHLQLGGGRLFGLSVERGALEALAHNGGVIGAGGGQVLLTAQAADALTASVVNNAGVIEASHLSETDGVIRLQADRVIHEGTSTARGARIDIAARDFYLDGRVDVSNPDGQAGEVQITTSARHEGMAGGRIAADGQRGGRIRLEGGEGMVGTSATLTARGVMEGGRIELTGEGVYLLNATLDASAAGYGGTVHVGGGWQGGGELAQATEVLVGVGTEIRANGARGGEAVVWSTDETWQHGAIEARGQPGLGGRIEVSSRGRVTLEGSLDAGEGGEVLLDPKNIIITDTPPNQLTWVQKLATGVAGTPAFDDLDFFGSVALDGDRLAVGASGEDEGGTDRGTVHLFTGVGTDFTGLTWQKKLASGMGAADMPALEDGDEFGYSVALDGDRLIVGAPFDSDRGAVHLFTGVGTDFSGLTWAGKLASGTGATDMPALPPGDQFGHSVALDGDRLAVGIPFETGGLGAVHLFTGVGTDFSGLAWQKKLASGTGAVDMPVFGSANTLGISVALDGDRLVVGALADGTGSIGSDQGAVHLFTGVGTDFSGLTWAGTLASGMGAADMPALNIGDSFGFSVALDGDRLAVGALGTNADGIDRGAVYLFTGVGTDFSELALARTVSSGTGAIGMPSLPDNYLLGFSVALDGDRMAIGAPFDSTSGNARGAVHLFTGLSELDPLSFAESFTSHPGVDSYLTPAQVAAILDTGSSLTLQANNDITLASALTVDNPGGAGGALTLQAGRSVLIQADVVTDDGDLTLIANEQLAAGVQDAYREAGAAQLEMADGVTIDAGTGTVRLELRDGAGKTHRDSGDVTLGSITAGQLLALNDGPDGGDVVIRSGATLAASGGGDALVLAAASGGDFINDAGAAALSTPAGRWLVYSTSPAGSLENGLTAAAGGPLPRLYDRTYAANAPGTIAAGNHLIYSFQPTLTVTADDAARVYGEVNPAFSATLTGYVTDDGVTDTVTSAGLSGTASLGTAATATSSVGPYAITASSGTLASEAGYGLTFVDGQLTITQRPITVTVDAGLGKVYGEADPTLTYNITSGNLVGTDTLAGALERVAGEDVGTYAISQGTLTAGSNYTISFVGNDFVITPRPITVTVDVGLGKVYGEADPTLTYNITSGNLVGTDTLAGALERVAGEDVGTYAIGQGTLTAGSNYTISFVGNDFVITPRPITVTVDVGLGKVYGEADPTLTYNITSGNLVGTDTLAGALERVAGEDVGTYAISQGTLTAGSNYTISFVGNDFVITPRPLTVTADDLERFEGEPNPPFTARFEGFAFDETVADLDGTLSLSTTATSASAPGEYAIVAGGLSSSNYLITYVDGTLTVRPAADGPESDPLERPLLDLFAALLSDVEPAEVPEARLAAVEVVDGGIRLPEGVRP